MVAREENNEQSEIGTKKRMSLSKLTRAMYIIKDLQNHKELKAMEEIALINK